jgi:hypothetical protein
MINLLVDSLSLSLSLASAAVVLMLSLTIVCFGSSSLMWGVYLDPTSKSEFRKQAQEGRRRRRRNCHKILKS